ncbi:MAG: polysaccharide biosynthesis protein [Clostridia bacterium]|nr:polysaccharide biosynthesis protein [Clostridia bacterium]
MEKTRKQHNFLHGALILVIATALVKVIGAIFRIPLGKLLGGEGMGYYSSAYDLYAPIYTIAMAGLPIAISKLVAEAVAQNRFKDAKSLLRVAQRTFFITGLAGFMLISLIAYPFAVYINKNFGALYSVLVIAPSMLFCCIMACYRGYYEGLKNMYPTAISQVIEALCKLIFGFGFAYVIMQIGMSQYNDSGAVFGQVITATGEEGIKAAQGVILPFASAGAIGGVTLGTIIGAIYLLISHKSKGDGITAAEIEASPEPYADRENFKTLMKFALPVVLGALAQNLASIIDLITVQGQLNNAMGISAQTVIQSHGSALLNVEADKIPTFLYGCYKGFAYSFYNLVPTVTSVIGISVLPNLAAAWYEKNKQAVKFNIESVLRMTTLIAAPMGLGIAVLSNPILTIFFSDRPDEVIVSADLLFWLAIAGIFAGIAMPITSMLQAIGKQKVPVVNILIGLGAKIILNAALVVIPEINILGAAISTVVCYVLIVVLNIISLAKHSGVMPNLWTTLGKPFTSAILCAISAFAVYGLASNWLGAGRMGMILSTGISVVVAVIVFCVVLFCLKTITKDDVKLLPKGEKIAKVLEKFKVLG